MPRFAIALSVSLMLNAGLGVAFLRLRGDVLAHRTAAAGRSHSHDSRVLRPTSSTVSDSDNPAVDEDAATVLRRMRAAGFPNRVLKSVAHALARRGLSPAECEALGDSRDTGPNQAAFAKLNAETLRLMDQLDLSEDDTDRLARELRFGSIPLEKIRALERELPPSIGGLNAEQRSVQLRDTNARLRELLTPRETFEYNLRNSGRAQHLAQTLSEMNPTEAEFRAFFATGEPDLPDTDLAGLEAVVGEARLAEYRRELKDDFRATRRLCAEMMISPAEAPVVWTVLSDAFSRAAEVAPHGLAMSAANQAALEDVARGTDALLRSRYGEGARKIFDQMVTHGYDAPKALRQAWQGLQPPAPRGPGIPKP